MNNTSTSGRGQDTAAPLERLVAAVERTNDRLSEWTQFIHYRFEMGAREMAELRAMIARLEARLDHPATPEPPPKRPNIIVEILQAGKEFVEAVASLKELAIAIAIIVAAGAVMSNPAALRDLIATYSASGPSGHE